MIRVCYGVFFRGEWKRTFASRSEAEAWVYLYPGATIEPLTFTRQ